MNYTGDILLVGINYDKNSKEHQCLIEKYKKEKDGEYDTDSIVGVVCEHLESEGYMCDYISEDVAIEF